MIDQTDRSLIALLQRDARQTIKGMADQLGIAPSTCLERVRSLQHRGVIMGYHAEVNLNELGRTLQAIHSVRLSPKTPDIIERFIDQVWKMPETISVMLLSGDNDVEIHLAVRDSEHLRQIILNGIATFPGIVDERTSLVFEYRRKQEIGPIV
jgi:DNA-binding Lrp family transcriptional regulator